MWYLESLFESARVTIGTKDKKYSKILIERYFSIQCIRIKMKQVMQRCYLIRRKRNVSQRMIDERISS